MIVNCVSLISPPQPGQEIISCFTLWVPSVIGCVAVALPKQEDNALGSVRPIVRPLPLSCLN